MDYHVRVCEELFSAARSEFKHLEYFYFHNFVYEHVWKDNRRRHAEKIPTVEVMRTYGHDYKLIVVGDATMSPYEIVQPGGSIEHWNEESGSVWMQRLAKTWPHHVWLNPEPVQPMGLHARRCSSLAELIENRMFPLDARWSWSRRSRRCTGDRAGVSGRWFSGVRGVSLPGPGTAGRLALPGHAACVAARRP